MRLNSCFSWKSATLPARRALENCRTSTSFQFGQAAEHARAVDDQLADRVHHAIEPLKRNAHGFGLRQGLRLPLRRRRPRGSPKRGRRSSGGRFRARRRLRCCGFVFDFFRCQFRDAREQRIDCGGHFRVARPLAVQEFLQHVDRLQQHVHDFGAGLQNTIAQAADQVLHAMRDRREPVQADLRGRAFHRVHRAEQAVNVVRVGIAFERQQAFGDGLQMFFGLGNEELENFVRDIAILRQAIDVRNSRENFGNGFAASRSRPASTFGFGIRGRRSGECKCVALLERGDVVGGFRAVRTDLQQIEFEHGDRVGEEFGERAVHVGSQHGVHGVVKDVRHLRGHFGKFRKAVARRTFPQACARRCKVFRDPQASCADSCNRPEYSRRYWRCSEASWRNSSSDSWFGPFTGSLHSAADARLRCARLAINPAIAEHDRLEFHRHVRQEFPNGPAENSRRARARRRSGAESARRRSSEKYISTFMQKMQSILPT